MIFIGVALLAAIGLALIVSADAGSLVGLTQAETAQLIPLVAILLVLAGGAFGRRQRLSQILVNLTLWFCIFGVILVGYTYRDHVTAVATRVMGELTPGAGIIAEDGHSVSFRRGLNGSFRVLASVNGTDVPMIFDTGATAVVLSYDDARQTGIATDELRYTIPVQTANGMGRAARIRLERVSVGGIARERIVAFVAEKGALETSLMGMTFLETLTGYAVSGDLLELRN